MTAAPKPAEAPAPQMQGSPPGPVQWCANCVHFRPGPITVQGSTLGGCFVPPMVYVAGGKLSAEQIDALLAAGPGAVVEVVPAQATSYHQPRETLASAWCSQHKQRVGVLT